MAHKSGLRLDEEEAKKYQLGWWSGKVSGTGGLFAAPYPRITVRFVPRVVFGLKVIGDKQKGEYPADFEIKLYNNEGLIYTETVTGNTEVHWEKSVTGQSLYDVSRMELEISRWSHVGRVAKIAEFYTSYVQVYDDSDIISLSVLEEREISKGSLPIGNISSNELDLRLINIDDRFNEGNIYSQYHNMMKPNRKIRVWLGPVLESGLVEYQPLGTFWTQEWDVPETDLYADTSARDRMQRLDESTYNCALYNNTNLYDRIVHILHDAGLEPSEFWVDEALKNEIVEWFWIKPCSHREALRQVVERALGQAYSSRKGIVRIEGVEFIKMPEQEDEL